MKSYTSGQLAQIVVASKVRLSFADQLNLAEFLCDGVACWDSLQDLNAWARQRKRKPWEPEAERIPPLVAILRRRLHPGWSLYLPNRHLSLLREIQLPSRHLPALLLEESIWRAGRGLHNMVSWLKLPRALVARMDAADHEEFSRPLRVRLEAAMTVLHLQSGRYRPAFAHLQAAERYARALGDEAPWSDVHIARGHLARFGGDADAFEHHRAALDLADDPIRKFEIASEGILHLAESEIASDDARWVLGHLKAEADPIRHLNGLFHKSKFIASINRQYLGFESLAAEATEELAGARGIEQYGDGYSQAMRHQLLGQLQETLDPVRSAARYQRALEYYAAWKLLLPYRNVLARLYCLPGLSPGELEKYLVPEGGRAAKAFGGAEARRMKQIVERSLKSSRALSRVFGHLVPKPRLKSVTDLVN